MLQFTTGRLVIVTVKETEAVLTFAFAVTFKGYIPALVVSAVFTDIIVSVMIEKIPGAAVPF